MLVSQDCPTCGLSTCGLSSYLDTNDLQVSYEDHVAEMVRCRLQSHSPPWSVWVSLSGRLPTPYLSPLPWRRQFSPISKHPNRDQDAPPPPPCPTTCPPIGSGELIDKGVWICGQRGLAMWKMAVLWASCCIGLNCTLQYCCLPLLGRALMWWFFPLLLAFCGDVDCETDLDFLLFGVFHGVFTQRLKKCVI